jgi:hypothetical protein
VHVYIQDGHGDSEVCWKDRDYGRQSPDYPVTISPDPWPYHFGRNLCYHGNSLEDARGPGAPLKVGLSG